MMTQVWKNPGFVLLVEDNPQDRVAAIRAFGRAGVSNPIVQCEEGDDALDFLSLAEPGMVDVAFSALSTDPVHRKGN